MAGSENLDRCRRDGKNDDVKHLHCLEWIRRAVWALGRNNGIASGGDGIKSA